MAIIAFWSEEKNETGQTLSMVALSTYMAIQHNYKILNVSTNFRDRTLEDCYWIEGRQISLVKKITNDDTAMVGLQIGIEGLTKIIRSNKTTPNIVSNYSKAVFNDRLDVLCSPKTEKYNEYCEIAKMYPDIIGLASRTYDYVFVDISKRMDKEDADRILEMADIIIINITQKLSIIEKYAMLKTENSFFKNNNIMINIGRYDRFSKYNIKNISRFLGLKKEVSAVPYNTLFFESCSEGKVAEFFLRLRSADTEDRNGIFMSEIEKMTNELIYKIQALQMKM